MITSNLIAVRNLFIDNTIFFLCVLSIFNVKEKIGNVGFIAGFFFYPAETVQKSSANS